MGGREDERETVERLLTLKREAEQNEMYRYSAWRSHVAETRRKKEKRATKKSRCQHFGSRRQVEQLEFNVTPRGGLAWLGHEDWVAERRNERRRQVGGKTTLERRTDEMYCYSAWLSRMAET